jgi:NAD(P)-dependent dehydrogenase (short-subunit alcohol dehydrogenase family)
VIQLSLCRCGQVWTGHLLSSIARERQRSTEEDFHRQFNTNVLGAILAPQEAVEAFDGSGGSVINLSTISSTNPSPNTLIYSASKSAIDTITRELAVELADRGIRVNAIAPGMTETEGFVSAGLSAESAKALGGIVRLNSILPVWHQHAAELHCFCS